MERPSVHVFINVQIPRPTAKGNQAPSKNLLRLPAMKPNSMLTNTATGISTFHQVQPQILMATNPNSTLVRNMSRDTDKP